MASIVSCLRAAWLFATLSCATAERRFFSIGDLHGNFDQASSTLRNLGLMDASGAWTGGDSVLIQTGDVADRGEGEMEIYKALFRLQDEALQSGGEVILLLGNHELMNMQGDFSYAALGHESSEDQALKRTEEFSPRGWLGEQLRRRTKVVARLGEKHGFSHPVVYVHAGILPAVAKSVDHRFAGVSTEEAAQKAVDALNADIHQRIAGKTWEQIKEDDSKLLSQDGEGPLWTRRLARSLISGLCVELEESLRVFGSTRMIVGHTTQADGKIHTRCRGRLVLADTGINPSSVEVRPKGEAISIYPKGLSDRKTDDLSTVDPLIQDEADAAGALTPELRWHLQVLGLEKNELPAAKKVKQVYRRLLMKHHPDKGGNPEEFRDIQNAYDAVLQRIEATA